MDWASDNGSDWGSSNGAAKNHAEALKEVGILTAASAGTAFALSAYSSYSYAKDPAKGGMPAILGPIGLDTAVGLAGLAAAVFLGDQLGEIGQTVALGVGLGGINLTAVHYGAAVGASAANSTGDAPVSRVTGNASIGQGSSGLSPEAQAIYNQYVGR